MLPYIVGAVIIPLGIGIVLKTEWLINNFGSNAWAEAKFGTSGGSRILYKLIGLCIIFLGLVLIFGLYNGFMNATVGKIFIR